MLDLTVDRDAVDPPKGGYWFDQSAIDGVFRGKGGRRYIIVALRRGIVPF